MSMHGGRIVATVLNLPLWMIYLPMFGMYGLFDQPSAIASAGIVALGVLLWMPPLYALWYLFARRRRR